MAYAYINFLTYRHSLKKKKKSPWLGRLDHSSLKSRIRYDSYLDTVSSHGCTQHHPRDTDCIHATEPDQEWYSSQLSPSKQTLFLSTPRNNHTHAIKKKIKRAIVNKA